MFRRAGLIAALCLATGAWAGEAPIRVDGAYARGPGPAPVGAAFMELTNTGDVPDRLVGVAAAVAVRVELHSHEEGADGVMRMGPVEGGIPLAPGETRVLKRGGDHVMLMGLDAPLADGDTVLLTLIFEKAGALEIAVRVDNDRAPGEAER